MNMIPTQKTWAASSFRLVILNFKVKLVFAVMTIRGFPTNLYVLFVALVAILVFLSASKDTSRSIENYNVLKEQSNGENSKRIILGFNVWGNLLVSSSSF